MNSEFSIRTPITELLGLTHPIILAGMNKAAGPKLAAAVSNAGGMGVIGGLNYSPKQLKRLIKHLKKDLIRPDLPFGIDLLLPKVGSGARKTNYDYTKGKLDGLMDVIVESGAKLFVSAVGVPSKQVVQRCHDHGILVMNMVGHPKHCLYAIEAGVDIICAQGGEGGGHTGSVPTSLLIPKCVDICKHHRSEFTGQPIHVIAAGGIYDGRGLAMALAFGAEAVWVGTRFVASVESGASMAHKKAVVAATYDDTYRTLIYTGRPMRVIKNTYCDRWEQPENAVEIRELLESGVIPVNHDIENRNIPMAERISAIPHLSGQVAGAISEIKPAAQIMAEMFDGAVDILQLLPKKLCKL